MEKQELLTILSGLAKKGFYEILLYVSKEGTVHYSDVLQYVSKNKIVRSDATVTKGLNFLSDHGLVARKISQGRPIRTTYELTDKGKKFVSRLSELQVLSD